jgi:hypothetical protein
VIYLVQADPRSASSSQQHNGHLLSDFCRQSKTGLGMFRLRVNQRVLGYYLYGLSQGLVIAGSEMLYGSHAQIVHTLRTLPHTEATFYIEQLMHCELMRLDTLPKRKHVLHKNENTQRGYAPENMVSHIQGRQAKFSRHRP